MNIHWDAEKYARDFSFVAQHGEDLISLLDKHSVYSVLDLGCGNGILTNRLYEEGFSVCGIDSSDSQLQTAVKNYPHISFVKADATDFTLSAPVDAVFSNAVFHWINRDKQPDLLSCVYRALKENGQFVFEFGGYKNGATIHDALRLAFEKRNLEYKISFFFPTAEEYAALLESAGFKSVSVRLFDRPTPLKGENGLSDWIEMFVKEPFQSITEAQKNEIVTETVNNLRSELYQNGIWIADYVRIRGTAIKK